MGTSNPHLKILTWNATGIMSSSSYLRKVLYKKKIDVCKMYKSVKAHFRRKHRLYMQHYMKMQLEENDKLEVNTDRKILIRFPHLK